MRFHTPSLLAASCLFLSHTLSADIIILKNNERIEGKFLREVDGKVYFEVNITPTIKDEKVIPRSEVSRIEKEAEDQKVFLGMADYVPTPDLLSEDEYKERMDRLEAFLKMYPNSRQERKVKQMLDSLGAELDVVSLGGIKIGGKMITGDRYAANAYEYDALVSEKKIKEVVARRDFLTALRMFEKYEASFPQSEGYAELKKLKLQVLIAYRDIVRENLDSLDARIMARSNGLLTMTLEDRMRSERAIQEQSDAITKRLADEKLLQATWVTPDAFHRESLTSTMTNITAAIGKIDLPAPAFEKPLAEVYRDAWRDLAEGTDQEKMEVLKSAKENKLPEPYLAKLRARAALSEKSE